MRTPGLVQSLRRKRDPPRHVVADSPRPPTAKATPRQARGSPTAAGDRRPAADRRSPRGARRSGRSPPRPARPSTRRAGRVANRPGWKPPGVANPPGAGASGSWQNVRRLSTSAATRCTEACQGRNAVGSDQASSHRLGCGKRGERPFGRAARASGASIAGRRRWASARRASAMRARTGIGPRAGRLDERGDHDVPDAAPSRDRSRFEASSRQG